MGSRSGGGGLRKPGPGSAVVADLDPPQPGQGQAGLPPGLLHRLQAGPRLGTRISEPSERRHVDW